MFIYMVKQLIDTYFAKLNVNFITLECKPFLNPSPIISGLMLIIKQ